VNAARRRTRLRVHVALTTDGWHPDVWELPYVGDPHWVTKEIGDEIHELEALLQKLAPVS
jgi:hypothetical protein